MVNASNAASRFVIEHHQLQQLPELIGDHTGIIATTITTAFEAVAVYGDRLSIDGVELYQKVLRAYLPRRDITALMAATSHEQLMERDLSEKLNPRFLLVQKACMELSWHLNHPDNPVGSYVDTVLDLVTLFSDAMEVEEQRRDNLRAAVSKGLALAAEQANAGAVLLPGLTALHGRIPEQLRADGIGGKHHGALSLRPVQQRRQLVGQGGFAAARRADQQVAAQGGCGDHGLILIL